MVKSGSFKVSQGSLGARIGTGLGKGLGEQLPKEIAQQRLSSGLKNFAQNAPNLSPLEQYTQLASIPGITPQMIQVLPQVLQQQRIGESLSQAAQGEPRSNQQYKESVNQVPQENQKPPIGLETREGTEAALEGFIPRSYEEKVEAAKLLPIFQSNPQEAINIEDQKDLAAERQSNALQARRKTQLDVQNKIKDGLEALHNRYNNILPGDVYTDIENDTLQSIKSKAQGGEGLTESQAERNGAERLKEVSRQYQSLKTLGGISNYFRNPRTTLNGLDVLQKQFKERGDLRNFADSIIAETNASAPKAYSIAYPIKDYPKLNSFIQGLPKLKANDPDYTADIVPKLFNLMGTEASPLAIGNALNAIGYNGNAFLNYARERQNKLSPNQQEQLSLPTTTSLGDIFMENMWGSKAIFGGIPLFYHYLGD